MSPAAVSDRSKSAAEPPLRRGLAALLADDVEQSSTVVEWLASSVAFLVRLAGVVSIVSGLLPPDDNRLRTVADALGLPVADAAAALSVVAGVVLILVARGLRRRQRRAWRLAVGLLCGGALLHLVKGLDVEEAALCLLVVVALLLSRSRFRALPDPEQRHHPLVMFVVLLSGSVLAGLFVLQLNLADVSGGWAWGQRLQTVLRGLVGLSGPVHLPTDRGADLVGSILLGLGLMTVVLPIIAGLRTFPDRGVLTAVEAERVRRLLDGRPGGDSLGYFALRNDKRIIFSPSGKAAVSYRVVSGVALASGDPLGDPEAWPGAIAAFLGMAADSGWVPAVLGCSERGGTAWDRAGLSALEIGDEAIVDVDTFTLSGRAMRGVRQAAARAERAGCTTRVRRVADLSLQEREAVRLAADHWRDGPTERGFSMALGRLGEPGDEQCVLVEARCGGELQALLHFVPWGREGLSLDLMRRSRDSVNGVNELLVVAALSGAAELGIQQVSLNFALFRSALERGARLGAGPILRAWRGLLLIASRFWQIDSLYRFNEKFRPRWEPRFVCFRRSQDLGRVLVAALQAEAFLPVPRLPIRLLGRRSADVSEVD